jgi:murein DD-endopeptidase MepM/ murein hydrolase activator NlpD
MWDFPIRLEYQGLTDDSDSFKNIDTAKQVELPIGNHCGAFGVARKHDHHGGVDLYCPDGTAVYAVDYGKVVHIRPFTGAIAGFPWWNDTYAISIDHGDCIAVYGEIYKPLIKVGDRVDKGDCIALVKQVLVKDKGRPMSMLHFALHSCDVLSNRQWDIGLPQASGLFDPTNRLIRSNK